MKHGNTPVTTIFVHCSATRPEWMAGQHLAAKFAEIRRWHVQDRKWRDIGYHWIIDRDGSIAPGRPETTVGAHVAGHNTGSIGICLIGGHGSAETDAFAENFTPAQDAALRKLIADIRKRAPITAVRGHNEVAAKACPGFNVSAWLAEGPRRPVDAPSAPIPAAKPSSPWAGFWAALVAMVRGRA